MTPTALRDAKERPRSRPLSDRVGRRLGEVLDASPFWLCEGELDILRASSALLSIKLERAIAGLMELATRLQVLERPEDPAAEGTQVGAC